MTLSQSLFVIALLIAASAFFSLAEISLAASRRLRLRQLADDGDLRADKVLRVQAAALQLGKNLQADEAAALHQAHATLLEAGLACTLDRRPRLTAETEAIGRLVLDPLSATIFSSDPGTYAAIQALEAKGMPLADAIRTVAGLAPGER